MGCREPCADTDRYFFCEDGYCNGTGEVSIGETVHKDYADPGKGQNRELSRLSRAL